MGHGVHYRFRGFFTAFFKHVALPKHSIISIYCFCNYKKTFESSL